MISKHVKVGKVVHSGGLCLEQSFNQKRNVMKQKVERQKRYRYQIIMVLQKYRIEC